MMIRLIANVTLAVLGNAAGLLVAALLIDGFSINVSGFVMSVAIFTVAELVLSPFVLKLSIKYLPALRGGIALATTLVALVLASLFSGGLHISGLSAWLVAPFIVWIATVIAGVLLPLVIFKKTLAAAKSNRKTSQL